MSTQNTYIAEIRAPNSFGGDVLESAPLAAHDLVEAKRRAEKWGSACMAVYSRPTVLVVRQGSHDLWSKPMAEPLH